jgi:hypothetical protein
LTNEPAAGGSLTSRGGQRAGFLSYASEDAQAAHSICAALRAAGIEEYDPLLQPLSRDARFKSLLAEMHQS